jgi:hypothetical protein
MGLWSSFKASLVPPPPPAAKAPSINVDTFAIDKAAPPSIEMLVAVHRDLMSTLDELHAKLHAIDARQWFYDLALLYILYKVWHI